MPEIMETQTVDLIELVGDIVSTYVSHNPVQVSELPDLIRRIHATLNGLESGAAPAPAEAASDKRTPAQIRKSVTPDGIVSFLDGKSYKTMKRHLRAHGLDAESYRERFGLPDDYPMIAASYATQRSAMARSIGLGRVVNRNEDQKPKGRKTAA